MCFHFKDTLLHVVDSSTLSSWLPAQQLGPEWSSSNTRFPRNSCPSLLALRPLDSPVAFCVGATSDKTVINKNAENVELSDCERDACLRQESWNKKAGRCLVWPVLGMCATVSQRCHHSAHGREWLWAVIWGLEGALSGPLGTYGVCEQQGSTLVLQAFFGGSLPISVEDFCPRFVTFLSIVWSVLAVLQIYSKHQTSEIAT